MARKTKQSKKSSFVIPMWMIIAGASLLGLGTSGYVVTARMEENDAFCASCHSEPETTYYQRNMDTTPVDLASAHHGKETRCIDCHSGAGIPGRIGGMVTGAGDLATWVTGTAKQPAPLTHPITDSHCLKCHQDVPRTQDFQRHFHAFLSQWQAMDSNAATCVDCHSAHTTDGSVNGKFLNDTRTRQVCESCHRAAGR